jgi:hypothetical protein
VVLSGIGKFNRFSPQYICSEQHRKSQPDAGDMESWWGIGWRGRRFVERNFSNAYAYPYGDTDPYLYSDRYSHLHSNPRRAAAS